MKRIIVIFLGAVILQLAACDEDEHGYNYYNYYDYSFIDTILAADTIENNDPVQIVHVYPAGCNSFARIETLERGDTLDVAALYNFYFVGKPCVHGSGLDTTSYCLHFSSSGAHYLSYQHSENIRIVRPIYVEE